MQAHRRGFTLIEIMIVMAVIAIVASMAVPNLLASRVAANEAAALSAIRNLVNAQFEFKTIAAVDVDLDGAGEFGSFGEMSGATALNARGVGPATALPIPILGAPFENIDANGRARKAGYFFIVYLPDGANLGLPEVAGGGPDPAVSADPCEMFWSCYAWPVDPNNTGTRAFFVDYRGDILQTKMENPAAVYSSFVTPPFNAALTGATMDTPAAVNGVGVDNNNWTALR